MWHTPERHDQRTGTSHSSASSRMLDHLSSHRTSRPVRTNEMRGPDPGTPPGNGTNLALNKATKSKQASCAASEGPAKAVNGSVSGGNSDKWCSAVAGTKTLEVDLGANKTLTGYGGGLPRKKWLLDLEGAPFKDRLAA